MNIEELKNLIKNCKQLNNQDKEKWISYIPKMNQAQLVELATNLIWVDKQTKTIDEASQKIPIFLKMAFTQMNKYAAKEGKKAAYKAMENTDKSKQNTQNLLKELQNA